jgi:hypothetical protein
VGSAKGFFKEASAAKPLILGYSDAPVHISVSNDLQRWRLSGSALRP